MKKKGLIAALIACALVLVASPAQADVIGGGGTSTGGALSAGANAPGNWDRVVGIWDPSGSGAFDDFLAAAVGNGRYGELNSAAKVEGHLRDMGILEQCRSSRLIVFLRDENYGVWMRYTSGFGLTGEVSSGDWTTNPGYGHVFITERNSAGQPSWTDNWSTTAGQQISPKQEVMNYASAAPRDTNIICAWGANKPTITSSVSRNQATVSDSASWTKPYSWSTSVKREISATRNGQRVDPIGQNNLNDQAAVTKKSAFAGVYDGLKSSGSENERVGAKEDRVNEALNSDKNAAHSELNLNTNNKAGLAEGGVLSVYEYTTYATINSSERTVWERCNEVSNERYWNGSAWVDRSINSGPIAWDDSKCNSAPLVGGTPSYNASRDSGNANFPTTGKGWRSKGTSYTNSKSLGTAQNTGFWQILSVHCNPTELAALLNAVSGEQVVSQTVGVDGKSTAVVYSKKYTARPAARSVDFGSATNSNRAAARTAELGFYDKECDLTCVSTPTTSTGASTTNGATKNVSTTTNQTGKSYNGGVTLNTGVNSNYLEIFRDNDDRNATVNVSYPKNSDPQFKYGGTYRNEAGTGTITIPAAAAVSTTITRWADGTPGDGTRGGTFSMYAVNASGAKTKLFTGSGTAPVTQVNWATNPYQTVNSTTLNGFYRDFDVKATWASETDKPQVVNIKWEYRPTVWTRFPSKVGFAGSTANNLKISSYTVKDQALDGRCYAQYGTNERDLGLSTKVQQSTGTGTTNTLDRGLVESTSGDNSWQYKTNLVLKFVRAVSE